MTDLKLTPEEQFILACLRMEFSGSGVAGFPVFAYESFDWDRVYKKSIQWRIAPLLYKILEKRIKSSLKNCPPLEGAGGGQPSIPKHFLEKLKVKYLITSIANGEIYKDLAEISEVFGKAGIKFILLKGSHLAKFVYQDIGMRPMGDIDILVKKKDLQKAEELLLQMGYNNQHENIEARFPQLHLPTFFHPEGKVPLELHWTIIHSSWELNIDVEGIWERVNTKMKNGIDMIVFSTEDLLLYLSIHATYHHKLKILGLVPYCDIAMIIKLDNNDLDWNKLQARAHEWRTAKYLNLSLCLSHELFDAKVPESILSSFRAEPLNKNVVLEAKKRILSATEQKSPYSDVPYLFSDGLNPNNSIMRRMHFILQKIFISPKKLAAYYSLPENSKYIYFYYCIRFFSILYRYFLYLPYYAKFYIYWLTHKKGEIYGEYFDLWLLPSGKK